MVNDVAESASVVVNRISDPSSRWGVATIILGGLATVAPLLDGVAVTVVVAVLLVAAGITQDAYAFKAEAWGKGIMQLLLGGITVFCGAAMLSWPLMGLESLTILLASYFLADG